MKLFLDTSSLIKLYYKEGDTAHLDKVFSSNIISQIFLSEISKVEFMSAIYKKVRTKNLTLTNADDIVSSFKADDAKYSFIKLNEQTFILSQSLIQKYGLKGLRSLDALQLALAVSIKPLLNIALTGDILLKQFLTEEGITCGF